MGLLCVKPDDNTAFTFAPEAFFFLALVGAGVAVSRP